MTATKKSTAKPATKSATKAATPQRKETPQQAEEREDQEDRAASFPATTSAGAITEPAQSSEEAMQARKAAPHAPAVVGGPATVDAADDVKPLAFAPDPAPANPAAVENLRTLQSRERAKLIGESVARQSDVGRGTEVAGKAEVTTFTKQVGTRVVEPETVESQQVSIPAGRYSVVFRESEAGVELYLHRPEQVNALSGPPEYEKIAVLTQDQWDALDALHLSTGEMAEAQSAAEQRQGVAKEGGDPGPAAPMPVRL
jgi:hypothetical protein